MQRKSLADAECPVARTLDQVGDWWSLLILRDAFAGVRRFAEFQESLGVATNMLSRRLDKLVDDGLLQRRVYAERPVRHEYLLTVKGRDLFPALAALLAWGNRWLAPEGVSMALASLSSGDLLDPVVVDATTGVPITPETAVLTAGPAAGPEILARVRRKAAA